MRIFSKSKIAFNVLLDIAAHTAQGRAISIPIVCRRHQLSHSYLELIFGQLRVAGLIRSYRGPGGGYSLAKSADEITLYEVVHLFNEQERAPADMALNLWANLDEYMALQMQQITLAKALTKYTVTLEPINKSLNLSTLSSVSKTSKVKKPKKILSKTKARLGPNSVFSFGEYLKAL
jgi:Rrf2 family iron-sulfur cluster assembly transcriptional regulator